MPMDLAAEAEAQTASGVALPTLSPPFYKTGVVYTPFVMRGMIIQTVLQRTKRPF